MSVTILIFYFVNFEMHYDSFHKNSNQIYRIITVGKGISGTDYGANTPLPLPEIVKKDVENVEMTTSLSLFLRENDPIKVENQTYFNLLGYTTDSSFLKMFNFPLIAGNINTIFDNPDNVIITQNTATRLFGKENPLGKELKIGMFNFTVVGILKDLPENSIFKFNLLVSNSIMKKLHPDLPYLWWWSGSLTFIKIYPNQNIVPIKASLGSIPDKYFPDFLKGRIMFDIQPLKSIHLDSRVLGDIKPPISFNYLYILMLIGIAVLFIACVNFVNLSTSQSEKRSREAGIRKLSGSTRNQIIRVHIGEATVISLVSLALSIVLSKLFLPWFNELAERNINIDFTNVRILIILLFFGVVTGIVSGIYPALKFSKFTPIQVIRSRIGTTRNKIGLRTGFIIIQFLITIVLITTQFFIAKQVSFMKNHELGFDDEDLISIPLFYNDENNQLHFAKILTENLEKEASRFGIRGVTLSENVPGQNYPNKFAIVPEGVSPENSIEMVVTSVDEHFTNVFKIPLKSGRILTDTIQSDKFKNVLINEMAARKLGWGMPLGKQIRFKHEKDPFTIVGVIQDINFKSLQTPIEPMVYRFTATNWLIGYLTLKLPHNNYFNSIKFIHTTWDKLAPSVPFQYFFIKDKYMEKYQGEDRLAKIVGTFALLAVLISCLGLFSMITFICSRRTKEIGIRKINGAKIRDVVFTLVKNFIKWVTIAFIIACPVCWFILYKWLQNFAYKTILSWWIYILAGMLTILIVLLTVVWQSCMAATKNPVEVLKYE